MKHKPTDLEWVYRDSDEIELSATNEEHRQAVLIKQGATKVDREEDNFVPSIQLQAAMDPSHPLYNSLVWWSRNGQTQGASLIGLFVSQEAITSYQCRVRERLAWKVAADDVVRVLVFNQREQEEARWHEMDQVMREE